MRRNSAGFTLIELMIVVAVIGILAAISIPLYGSVQQRARISKVQADLRAIAAAVSADQAHTGNFPPEIAAGQIAGPFLNGVPTLPSGGVPTWSTYAYASNANGMFSLSATGDGTTVAVP
jgi:prepilin-type N-terminal cleavage/methylation domain-containing protein